MVHPPCITRVPYTCTALWRSQSPQPEQAPLYSTPPLPLPQTEWWREKRIEIDNGESRKHGLIVGEDGPTARARLLRACSQKRTERWHLGRGSRLLKVDSAAWQGDRHVRRDHPFVHHTDICLPCAIRCLEICDLVLWISRVGVPGQQITLYAQRSGISPHHPTRWVSSVSSRWWRR
jgi:hypothetical protein